MRITVESAGFTQAAHACQAANEIAAITTQTLAGKLRHYAGMAGNDSTSTTFAHAYDDTTREALATLTDLTHAFTGLGHLIQTTATNHHNAEEASASDGRHPDGRGGTKSRHETTTTHGYTRVSVATPPSALGTQEHSLGPIDTWILDHVEGFTWPGADTALLHDAATTWRSSASSIDHLHHHLDDITTLLTRQHSPEIPLALDVLDNLHTLITDTTTQLTDLAQTCDDYATAVHDTHDRTKALLEEIGKMIIEGAVASALVAGITGGLGGGAAAGALITRISAQAPRFHTLLTTLHTTATTCASRARTTRDTLRTIRTRAEKLARIHTRDERGSALLGLGGGTRRSGWLRGHEVAPGHTIDRHVGKSVEELREQCLTQKKKVASSFASQEDAQRLISQALQRHRDEIKAWLESDNKRELPLNANLNEVTGTSVTSAGLVSSPTGVRVILIRKPDGQRGWQILTAFPN